MNLPAIGFMWVIVGPAIGLLLALWGVYHWPGFLVSAAFDAGLLLEGTICLAVMR